ncbi:MAG TPA: hypothetical protein VFG12_07070 [Rhodopila sp.]|nr:hypothetical protein [Rhodopila sp.]
MTDFSFDYPPILTNKTWQKAKGVLAKLVVGKTDVGAALTDLENEFGKSDFGKVKPLPGLDPTEYVSYEKKLLDALAKSGPVLAKKGSDTGKIALGAFGELSSSKAVPKSVPQYVKTIIAGLDTFETKVGSFPKQVAKDLREDFRSRMHKTSACLSMIDMAKKCDGTWNQLMSDIKKVEATPTVEGFKKVFAGDNPVRMMTTMCKAWDQLLARDMPTLANDIYGGKAMVEYFKLPCLASVANQSNAVASKEIEMLIEKSGQPEERVVTAYMLRLSSSSVKVHEMVVHCKDAFKVMASI